MFSLETLKIDLKALTSDSIETDYVLEDNYFAALQDADIQQGRVNAHVSLCKAGDSFALNLTVGGSVTVTCDRCLDDMDQPVKGESHFVVKLGIGTSEDDEILIVDENEGILDLSWIIYETIALAVPIKHVHAPGKCNAAMTERLEELSATRSGDEAEDGAVDPRWDKLKQLKDKL